MWETGELEELYENSLMEEWLATVGMRVFVEHYFELKSGRANLDHFSKASAKNRLIASASLFRNKLHLSALKRISQSKGVSKQVASLAQAIYEVETL